MSERKLPFANSSQSCLWYTEENEINRSRGGRPKGRLRSKDLKLKHLLIIEGLKNSTQDSLQVKTAAIVLTVERTHRRQCKMSSSKKLTCNVTLSQVFIYLRPRIPYPPPPHTALWCILYSTYIIIHTRKEGRVEPERKLEGQQFTKLVENTNMTVCISSL